MPRAKDWWQSRGEGWWGGGQLGNRRLLELGASKRATLFWHWRPTLCHMVCFLYFFTMFLQYLFLRFLLYLFLVILTRQFVCRLVCFLPEWHSQVSPPATEPPSYVSQTKHFGDQMDHFKYVEWSMDNCKQYNNTWSMHYAAIPMQMGQLGIWVCIPPLPPFSCNSIISEKIFGL